MPSDDSAQVVADEGKGVVPTRFCELDHDRTDQVEAVVGDVGRSWAAGAEAAEVGRDRPVAGFAEIPGLPPPGTGGLGEAVQQDGQRSIVWSGREPGVERVGYLEIEVV